MSRYFVRILRIHKTTLKFQNFQDGRFKRVKAHLV